MAQRKWRAPARVIKVRRRYPGEQARVTSESRAHRSRRPELLGLDAVALHLEVQGLVVDPQEARRLTPVPPRGLKSHADRLPPRLGGRPVGDVAQGGARLAVAAHRAVETPVILGPVSTVPPARAWRRSSTSASRLRAACR